jgi:hypothetical protein
MTPIFSDNFLSHYISDFRASSVIDMRGITLLIDSLIVELESGKIESMKEEEFKPRFINTFFGDILGFNYGNSNKWQLRDEKKSFGDGTKADSALGYFFTNKKEDDVRVVIEIKDANTDLDEKQNRINSQSPVEQAFSYSYKMGGTCKWVIVSNIKEIRFYHSLDSSKCQRYFFKDLKNETKRNELLFLFHKDRFIKEIGNSVTDSLYEKAKVINPKNDKPVHIIDKLFTSLDKFKEFGFIDPNFVATLYPFNILDEHVWQYNDRNLFTINCEIYDLLKGIDIENNKVLFSNELKDEIELVKVIDAKHKLETVFKFLNHCLIDEISAIKDYQQIEQKNKRTIGFSIKHSFGFKEGESGITKNIQIVESETCDCLKCNYRSLDFNRLLGKLKSSFGNENFNTSEYAYGNYLVATNSFKTTYNIYKAIEKNTKGKEGKEVEYFLTKHNIKYLHNLISDYEYNDSKDIFNDIKSIDLDKVIYDEIEFNVSKEVKTYLIDVKEDVLIYKLQDEIEEITFEIDKLRQLYEGGGKQWAGPNLPNNLAHSYYFLYLHINTNNIIYDTFRRYKNLTEKVFKGLVTSYSIPEIGLTEFNEFLLTEAILHISRDGLKEILKNVDKLKTDDGCIEIILQRLNNFTTSYFKDGLFNKPYKNSLLSEQLNNFSFKHKFADIFTKLFIILSKLDISKEQFNQSKSSILKFLKIEGELAWFNLKEFGNFVLVKGDLFEPDELMEILKLSINGKKYGYNKYDDLIKSVVESLKKYHPDQKVQNSKLIEIAILKCSSDDGDHANYKDLVCLINICNEKCSQILLNLFEKQLDEKFNDNLYESMLRNTNYDNKTKNYFMLYCEHINITKGEGAYKYGESELTDLVFINFIFLIYHLNIDFNRNELKSFTNLNDFETWLLNPLDFDYTKFEAKWLIDLNRPFILSRLKGIKQIENALETELRKDFNPVLAEIKYKL